MTLSEDRNEIAYLAGYFDGEGCITVEGGLRLLVTATHPGACVRLRKRFGGVLRPRKAPKDCKKQFQWTVYGEAAYEALDVMMRWLEEKRVQALIARAWYSSQDDPDLRGLLAGYIKSNKRVSWTLRANGDVVRSKDGDTDATIR